MHRLDVKRVNLQVVRHLMILGNRVKPPRTVRAGDGRYRNNTQAIFRKYYRSRATADPFLPRMFFKLFHMSLSTVGYYFYRRAIRPRASISGVRNPSYRDSD